MPFQAVVASNSPSDDSSAWQQILWAEFGRKERRRFAFSPPLRRNPAARRQACA